MLSILSPSRFRSFEKSSCSSTEFSSIVNYKRRSHTLCREGIVSHRCFEDLRQFHRGDVEIVKILLW